MTRNYILDKPVLSFICGRVLGGGVGGRVGGDGWMNYEQEPAAA